MNPTFSDWAKLRAAFVNVEEEPLTAVQWASLKAEFEARRAAWESSADKVAKRRKICIAILSTSFTLVGLELLLQDAHRLAALFFGLNVLPFTWFVHGQVSGTAPPYDLFFVASHSFEDIPLQAYDEISKYAETDPATALFVKRVLDQDRELNGEEFRAIERRQEKLQDRQNAEQRSSRGLQARRNLQASSVPQ